MSESTVQVIPFYAHPHVHTVINDNTFYDETTAVQDDVSLPYSTLAITGADSGIDNTFVRLTSKTVKDQIFGKSNFTKYGQPSIQADVLFNGATNVWFCRVLPENATYSNMIVMAYYRKGAILDAAGQETGMNRLEVKFGIQYAQKPELIDGARKDGDIERYANALASNTADPTTGYMAVPLFYVRSIGRGKYGNYYSMSIARDVDAEKEYDVKMYKFNLYNNKGMTTQINSFAGSILQSAVGNDSTLISDVLDQFSTGSCPVSIHPFESSWKKIYQFYQDEIVMANSRYVAADPNASDDDIQQVQFAASISAEQFDLIFGYVMNTQEGEIIPYYRNYTADPTKSYKAPTLTIKNDGSVKPLNTADWTTAAVGDTVLVLSDPLNGGARWKYTVASIDPDNGNILYDEGVPCEVDEAEYNGIDLTLNIGHMFKGGHDGDFQEISVNGELREPTPAEMKLLLSSEYVKVLRGTRDKKILSPARIDLDFIFDANYNMLTNENFELDTTATSMYSNSTVITDSDAVALSTLGKSGFVFDMTDINVKKALYDLNQFRNKNGMTISNQPGAGCSLYLDCGITGLKSVNVNTELDAIIDTFADYTGRATSIDLGYYEIFEPNSGKRIQVTTSYFIAKNLVPHLLRNGMESPFVGKNAEMVAIQKSGNLITGGDMIRDSFKPDIDLIDWDVKEKLFKARINYYVTENEGRRVQRAVQNTRQLDASALLEENNVRVLNALKKGLEKACRGYLYAWNEPEIRRAYTDTQMQIYKPWIGTKVQDLNIRFDANEWEQDRMIMHCYCEVAFRDIVKRIILEININRPEY